jgi:hypothetical protein
MLDCGWELSHLVVAVGEGQGSSYSTVEIELSLSCEGAFGTGALIGMGGMPRARGRGGKAQAMRAPMRLKALKGDIHGEIRLIATAIAMKQARGLAERKRARTIDEADSSSRAGPKTPLFDTLKGISGTS